MNLGGVNCIGAARDIRALAEVDMARMRASEPRHEVPRVLGEVHAEV